VLNRLVARRSWGLGLTLGLTNLAAALVFGSLALALFGPDHFLHMRLWWLVGVLVVYSGVINLGGDLALLASYRGLGAIAVALWGNAAVLVALASAHWLLGEAIGARTLVGAALILVALLVSRRWGSSAG
jgi:drug/metabolite transporter (DMT)-like permease